MTNPDPIPPRAWHALLRWTLPRDPVGSSVIGELGLEFVARSRSHPAQARDWYRRQARSVALRALLDRVRGRSWDRPFHRTRRHRGPRVGFDAVRQDLRDALRGVRRNRSYSATVIATLALAIGANVAVFSIVNSVLLRPLPYPNPDRLVMVHRVSARDGVLNGGVSGPDFFDWRRETRSFASLAAYSLARETYAGEDHAEEWQGVETTPELFAAMGTRPALGQVLEPGVDDPDRGTGIVLSHRLWQRRFAGDSSVIGTVLRFEDRTVSVIGVMPESFYFPTPTEEYWTSFHRHPYLQRRGAWVFRTLGRLAAGVELEEAQAELSAIADRIDDGPEGDPEAAGVYVERRHDAYVGDTRRLFGILLGSVAIVLAIACANLANLSLTRGVARRREFALRAALGAGGGRLVRQLLGESVALALVGGAAGVLLAYGAVDLVMQIIPGDLPRSHEVAVDVTALVYSAVVTIASGLVFGAAPAWRVARTDAARSLEENDRVGTGRRRGRALKALAVTQVSLALVLVVAAGLLLNSFLRLTSVRPGFDTDRVLTALVHLPRPRFDTSERVLAFYRTLSEQVSSVPGVDALGYTSHLPFSPSRIQLTYFLPGELPAEAPHRTLDVEVVGEDYLGALDIPLLAGRRFDRGDRADAPLVAVINESMVQRHWRNENPIGRRFTLDDELSEDHWVTVIGVAGNVLRAGLDDPQHPVAYFSLRQFSHRYGFVSGRHTYLTMRSDLDSGAAADELRRQVASLDAGIPVVNVRTTAELVGATVAEPRFRAALIGTFAGLALTMALVGIYAVLGFVVEQRTREIGVRMALGATAPSILRHVLGDGARLVALGLGLGATVAFAAAGLLRAMLFGVQATDPATYAGAAALLAGAALLASYLPARRASRLDPMTVLRRE